MLLRRLEVVTCLGFLAFLLGGCGTSQDTQFRTADQGAPAKAPPRQRLTAEGQVLLRSQIDAGQLTDLRRPDFAAYQNEVKKFYQSRDNTLAWIEDRRPTPQARALINAFDNAAYKGLEPEDYDRPRWSERLAQMQRPNLSESDLVAFDLALTVSAMRYISDLHNGRVNPRVFHFDFDIGHTRFDLSEFLKQGIVSSHNIDVALGTVEPPFPVYHRTEAALQKYLVLAQRDSGALLPARSKILKPGDSYAAIPLLAQRLALVGDLPGGRWSSEEIYRGVLVDGIKRFQHRHGLEPNGLIDAATIKELNTPLSRRVMQLQLRVEDPVALARWVLNGQPGWTEDNIRAVMNSDETRQVKLERPIPVLFLYGTAVVMEDGETHFFDDIYGQDTALEQALAAKSALNTSSAKRVNWAMSARQ